MEAGDVHQALDRVAPAVASVEAQIATLRQQYEALVRSGQSKGQSKEAQQARVHILLEQRNSLVSTAFTQLQTDLDPQTVTEVNEAIVTRYFPASLRQTDGSSTAPTAGPTMLDEFGRAIPADLAQMYKYAFHFQNSMEQCAADREKAGESGLPFQDILRDRFRLTDRQFLAFREASAEFSKQEQVFRTQIREELKTSHPSTRADQLASQASFETTGTDIRAFSADIRASANSQLEVIHRSLDAAAAAKLDTAVRVFYLEAQQAMKGKTIRTSSLAQSQARLFPRG